MARYLVSAGTYQELPAPHGVEFCIVGRSNVGKSSFINHLFNNRTLARISKMPGKTVCANVYKIEETVYWVDLPGYGYSAKGKSEQQRWSRLIDDYCSKRPNLRGVLWLLDIRHIGLPVDSQACAWLRERKLPVLPVLSKCDKLSRNDINKHIKLFKSSFSGVQTPVIYSILDAASRERFWQAYSRWSAGLSERHS
jgi:GTP-binding protein